MNHVFLIYRWLFALDALHRIFIGDAPGSQHHDADNDDQQQQRQPGKMQHTDIDLPGKLREPHSVPTYQATTGCWLFSIVIFLSSPFGGS